MEVGRKGRGWEEEEERGGGRFEDECLPLYACCV